MVTGDSVYGLEGASVVISCFINNYNTEDRVCTLALTVVDASGIRKRSYVNTGSYVFSIASLEKQHAGNYTVTCLKGKRTIQLHVLCKGLLII